MKKLLSVLGVLLGCSSMLLADNTMKMVTYFPVPYVAYSGVNAYEQMDIGLSGACELKLGSIHAGTSLVANNLNLKSGALALTGPAGTYLNSTIGTSIGDATIPGNAEMNFNYLKVGTVENGLSVEAISFNPATLKLFPSQASKSSTFPICNDGNGGNQMSWKQLSLKQTGQTNTYLVCGDTEESKCEYPRLMVDYEGYEAGDIDPDAVEYGYCCENGRLIEEDTGSDISEGYLDSWACCGPVYVCCSFPDGTRGMCAELGSGQEPTNCHLAGGGSHAITTCYTSSNGTPPSGEEPTSSCPPKASFSGKDTECMSSYTCENLHMEPCSRGCCTCSVEITSEYRVPNSNACIVGGYLKYTK